MSELNTPILFLTFNRPETTKKVFARIREVKPKQLFIAADGPREDRPSDKEKCMQTRSIVNEVDWKCDVKTLFRKENLGCAKAVSQAITWFFEHVEEGIILEDDIFPSLDFFQFCEEMLNMYRSHDKVMHISGLNFQHKRRDETSYYFSSYASSIWGWATWRRAWEKYDASFSTLDELIDSDKLEEIIPNIEVREFYVKTMRKTRAGKINSWGYIWLYSFWKNNGLSIVPNFNMIMNVGFDRESATHTSDKPKFLKGGYDKLLLPLVHPTKVARNLEADLDRMKMKYLRNNRKHKLNKLFFKLKNIIKE